ncbi:hypothetical protein BDC45DRAFT_131145 [Circinella umbellata]|nr:hypothetical protein BDC45DRAFT_131145 [Circinella umbellata]
MMNQQVFIFMATLLLVATTLVNAVPIPESFKRDVVQKRAYDHEAWQRQALASQQAVADQMAADNEKWQKEAIASQSSVAAAQASAFEAEAKAAGHPVEHKKQDEEKPTPTATTTEAPKKTPTHQRNPSQLPLLNT